MIEETATYCVGTLIYTTLVTFVYSLSSCYLRPT